MKMQPRTRILGIQIREEVNEKTGKLEKFFVKPAPESYAWHFKSDAWKRKVQADPTSFTDKMHTALYRVPRYDGIDNKLLRYLISAQKYAAKLASPDWKAHKYVKPVTPYSDLTFSGGTWVPWRFVS